MKIFATLLGFLSLTSVAFADGASDWSMGLSALSEGKQTEALTLINKAAEQGHPEAKTALRLMNANQPNGKPSKLKYQLLLSPEPP